MVAVIQPRSAARRSPLRKGPKTVRAIAENPTYTYNPDYGFKGVKALEEIRDQTWAEQPGRQRLDRPFGRSSSASTAHRILDKVGKTSSHGCARLTNWDAQELAKLVRKGTTVTFID